MRRCRLSHAHRTLGVNLNGGGIPVDERVISVSLSVQTASGPRSLSFATIERHTRFSQYFFADAFRAAH
jgi:hypothetical protein